MEWHKMLEEKPRKEGRLYLVAIDSSVGVQYALAAYIGASGNFYDIEKNGKFKKDPVYWSLIEPPEELKD